MGFEFLLNSHLKTTRKRRRRRNCWVQPQLIKMKQNFLRTSNWQIKARILLFWDRKGKKKFATKLMIKRFLKYLNEPMRVYLSLQDTDREGLGRKVGSLVRLRFVCQPCLPGCCCFENWNQAVHRRARVLLPLGWERGQKKREKKIGKQWIKWLINAKWLIDLTSSTLQSKPPWNDSKFKLKSSKFVWLFGCASVRKGTIYYNSTHNAIMALTNLSRVE